MANSMTGFGSATYDDPDCSLLVETRSVNNRYLNLKARIPGRLASLERKFDAIARRHLKRGSVDLFVRLEMKRSTIKWKVNDALLQEYVKTAGKLVRAKGVGDDLPSAGTLLALPGVMESRESREIPQRIGRAASDTVEKAILALAGSRAAEGKRMAAAVGKCRAVLEKIIGRIGQRIPAAHKRHVQNLKERVKKLLDGQSLSKDDATLQREVAFLADRADITEEMDRLASHLKQFDKTLGGAGPVGRALDFLVQEIGREVNTIGSKASDAKIAQLVVSAKSEIEKIREQIQNLE